MTLEPLTHSVPKRMQTVHVQGYSDPTCTKAVPGGLASAKEGGCVDLSKFFQGGATATCDGSEVTYSFYDGPGASCYGGIHTLHANGNLSIDQILRSSAHEPLKRHAHAASSTITTRSGSNSKTQYERAKLLGWAAKHALMRLYT